MTKTLKEAAAEVLGGNVKAKRGQADKPQRLPGEVQDLGAPVVKPDTPTGPDASKAVSKDNSKSAKASVGQEKVHKMKNKQSVPMQEDEELEDDYILDEDEELEEASQKTSKEHSKVDTSPSLTEEDDDDKDDDDDEKDDKKKKSKKDDDDEDEVNEEEEMYEEEFELPSVDDLELDLSEDVAAMFEGQDLSEEFMDRAALVFEAALRSNLKRYESQLAEMFEVSLNEAVESIKEEMEADVDKYLSYVVEEWVKDNEVAIESGLRNELTEDFMTGLRNLFVEHYIDIPEDKVDVVEELSSKIDELETRLNESIEMNIELSEELKIHARERLFAEAAEGLTDVQRAKLAELSESVDFDSEDSFAEKLNTLVESYFPANKPHKAKQLDEEVLADPESNQVEEEVQGPMAKYVSAIRKTQK